MTTPDIPGLELHIPPGVTLRDHDGKPVTEVSITAIPIDRTPFPLPRNVPVPIYFIIQPGSAKIVQAYKKARLIYPNYQNELPGTRFNFWHYEPEEEGWEIYGQGSVNATGKQVVPDSGVGIYEFTGAMVGAPPLGPDDGPPPCDPSVECCDQGEDGNPIDLATGLKIEEVTDITLADVIPITLTRTYRPRDTRSRAFGIGTSHAYDLFLVGTTFPYTYIDIVQPDGGRVHYDRISAGTSYENAIYENTTTPGRFYKSRITWTGSSYEVKLKDGTVYTFEEGFGATRPGQAGLIRYQDRNGNALSITRDANGNVMQIISPNGRWLQFTNDASNRITQIKDNSGRTVSYTYATSGRLWKVTDAGGGITEYTYDTSHRVLTKKDPRNNTVYTLQYDANGRVIRETLADGAVYQFAYTLDGSGKVTQVDVTNPRNIVRRVTFNSSGYILTDTRALGLPEQQTTTYTVQASSNLVSSVTDALNRRTDYTYDAKGNKTSMAHLAGTPDAMTTTYTYEPTFNQIASETDSLGHSTTYVYDTRGNLTSITDPLSQQTLLTYNSAGQQLSLTNPLGHTTQMIYSFGDLATVTDPLGNSTSQFTDSIGRVVNTTNSLGQQSRASYDALDRLTQMTDPLGAVTALAYDPNSNLLSLTDAQNGMTQYTYDIRNRQVTRKDPLLRQESFQYDGMNNATQVTDRKSQITSTTYDGLNRRTQVTYADGSTITYTYDAGNRITQIVDSVSGTISRTYDGMDNLLSETTPQGTVSYTYDHADRRASMTVAGQPTVTYSYDNADRLTQITQGTSVATFVYDAAGRRTSLTLPNSVVVASTYDTASRLTSLTYAKGATTLGDLTYSYDKVGRRIAIGGSFARTGVPSALSTASYDAANQQLTLGNKSMTFDANGNLATLTDLNGTTTYTWNARNQLATLSSPSLTANFQYDALGRRKQKTVNGTTTAFLYDDLNTVQELSGATPTANLLTGLGVDETLMHTDSSGAHAALSDALGSIVALTDPIGAVQTEYTYEPFGTTTFSGTASTNSFQYTGRENDGTGLYYYRARYYHPILQRFVAEDPAGFDGGGSNLYQYVLNNPINYTDPTGLWPGVILRGAAALAACWRNTACAQKLRELMKKAAEACKSVECVLARHGGHHSFPGLGFCEHYQFNCYIKGKGGSGFPVHVPIPGTCRPNKF